jgi:hypothetical protein
MGERLRYTNFPNLYGTVNEKQRLGTLQSGWTPALPEEVLILSWATLLNAYTGITDPVFSFEGKAIQVDIAGGSWTAVQVQDNDEVSGHYTAVTLNKVSLDRHDYNRGRSDRSLAM